MMKTVKHGVRSWFGGLSLKTKLLLLSSALLVLIFSFLAIVYGYWSTFIRDEVLSSFGLSCQQVELTIEDNLQRRQMNVQTLCESMQFQEFISITNEAQGEAVYQSSIKPVLDVLTETAKNGQMIQLIRYGNRGYEVLSSDYEGICSGVARNSLEIEDGYQGYMIVNSNRVDHNYWFRTVKGNLNEYHLQQVNMDYLNNCFSVVAEIRDEETSLGMVRLISPISDLIGSEPESLSMDQNNIFVLDESFYLVSSQRWKKNFIIDNREMFDEAIEQMRQGKDYVDLGNQWMVSGGQLGTTDYYLVIVASSQSLSEKTSQLQWIMISVFVTIFLLTSAFSVGVARYTSHRVMYLLHAMQRFEREGKQMDITTSNRDEIGLLYNGFSQMTEQIATLMERNVNIATEKKKADLQMLLMQINPHFLYNSLSAISRLAEWGETETIRQMVSALTTFYRLSLNKGKDYYTIADEKKQIEAYLQIFNVRKGDAFTSTVDFDQGCSACKIPKLILQPFVENIFAHAFSEDRPFLRISITQRRKGDMLVFTVRDNGCGIQPEKLEQLRAGISTGDSGGFGIANVMARLHLLFGEAGTVHIDSIRGQGTWVTIQFPCK